MKKGDTVYFKSPFGKEKGVVIDGPGPDGNITVETEDGTSFVFPKRKVMR